MWTRVRGDYTLAPEVKAITVVLLANETPDGGTVLFDDATLTFSHRDTELFDNPDLSAGTAPWVLRWGDSMTHNNGDGHLTINGSAQVMGHAGDGLSGIETTCMDISNRAPLDEYHVGASFKPGLDANAPKLVIFVDFYSTVDCSGALGANQIQHTGSPGSWSRSDGTFSPLVGTKSIRVVFGSSGTQDGGITLFDDLTLSLTSAVRQMWLFGVGAINNKEIQLNDMIYTRGGAFLGFDPADITAHPFVHMTITFNGCHTGSISILDVNGAFGKGYSIVRLAPNRAGLICDDLGFGNVGANNDWMAGTFYGGPSHNGEGFLIDVLEDGVTVIVSFYGYLPNWGIDAD